MTQRRPRSSGRNPDRSARSEAPRDALSEAYACSGNNLVPSRLVRAVRCLSEREPHSVVSRVRSPTGQGQSAETSGVVTVPSVAGCEVPGLAVLLTYRSLGCGRWIELVTSCEGSPERRGRSESDSGVVRARSRSRQRRIRRGLSRWACARCATASYHRLMFVLCQRSD